MVNPVHPESALAASDPQGISYPAAKDSKGLLHWASDAVKAPDYSCLGCDSPMVLRGGTRRRHFAHKPGSHCTAPETALHRLAKLTIKEQFEKSVQTSSTYSLVFQCTYCRSEHERNLVKRATSIKSETGTNGIIPDLTLFDANGHLLAAIEIVVTHLPSLATEKVYEALGIPVMLVFPEWGTVERLRESVRADVLINNSALCPKWLAHFRELREREQEANAILAPQFDQHGKCPSCTGALEVRSASIHSGYSCYKCDAENRVVQFGSLWTDFPAQEKLAALLRKLEVTVRTTHSKTVGSSYLMNRCKQCSAKFGDYFLHSETLAQVEYETREFGFCKSCGAWYPGSCKARGHDNPSVRHQVQARAHLAKYSAGRSIVSEGNTTQH